ncbi:M48 family metalloprotease [Halocatena marina]|uniref:M48 family metalloprotease n=1 Tax=Halocatena marina TaxID=2934937 RepID=A0ABD5YP36_9EURY|nr:M48 family metalloprotease [Halocatena marina]
MNWSRDWELGVRMAVTLGLLAIVTCVLVVALFGTVLLAVTWIIVVFEMNPVPPSVSREIAGVMTCIIIGVIIYVEFSGQTPVLRGLDTQSVDRMETEHSELLDRTVERLAQQAALPVPSVVVADTPVPNSYTSGLSSQQATIVVTTGLLEKLDPEELRAVLAHELAHVKHRDAAVMTVASVPLQIAQSIHEWTDDQRNTKRKSTSSENNNGSTFMLNVCYMISGAFWLVGRLLFHLLSRYRELAADRGAIALTGSPAALASALETISAQHQSLPREDLRSADGSIQAFAVVPVETEPLEEPIRLGPNGDQIPTHNQYEYLIQKKMAPFLATHPSVERRREQLQDIETEL